MSSPKMPKKWIVRDAQGAIFGPFSQEEVLEQIDRNFFLGAEQISAYPGGDWIPISKAPEFYDRLLDVIAAEAKGTQPSTDTLYSEKEATLIQQPSRASEPATKPTHAKITAPSALVFDPPESKIDDLTGSKSGTGPVLELSDLESANLVDRIREIKIPLIVMGVAVLIGAALFLNPKVGIGEKRIRLIAPRKNQAPLDAARLNDKFKRALGYFQNDTFTGYLRAENHLIETVEGASTRPEDGKMKAEFLSLLCLTYRELWPFAYQDAKDLKIVSEVMQEAKRVDPGGLHGSICELVQLILNGRTRDAQGLSEAVLLEKSQSPVLFEIRGHLFEAAQDYSNAANYFSQGRALWPGWQKNHIEEARARVAMKQFPEASQLFRSVLSKVPDHGVAKIELGLIEAREFNQFDKGLELIGSGISERVPRQVASRGHLGLAQIYVRKNQKSLARSAAQKAYDLDPGNAEAKELLVSLGGDDKLNQGESDLMFLGDQLMRTGDCYSAQAQFKAAFEANPKNGMAAMKAGKCLWQLNQTADAIEWLRRAIRADAQLIPAYVELADDYAQRFEYIPAIEVLKQAQAIQPTSFEVYRGFAVVELRRNNYKGAINYGQRALKIYETDIETLLVMAKSQLGLQQFPEAQKFAARAIDLDFNNIEAHSVYAKIEAGLHGIDSGAGYIQQLLNRYVITQGRQVPQAAIDLRITLGEIYMTDERFKQAEDVYRQSVGLDPNSKRALVALGKALQAQNQASAALEYFLRAAVLDPSDAEPVFASGQLYADTGKLTEATRQFERVLKINPRFPKAHTSLGRVALKRGDAKRALEEASQERVINPDLADAYTLAAEAYFILRQYSNCAAEYQKAVTKSGQGATVLVRMARCYRLSGALDSAHSLLRQAISIESGNPDIYKEQGAIFHNRGMADEAIEAYQIYVRLAPNAIDRGEVEARIRKIGSGDMSLSD